MCQNHTVHWRLIFYPYSLLSHHFSRRHINTQSRLQLHGVVVIPNRDLSEPAFGQFFVKLGQLIALLSDKILQLLDALHLDGLGSFIGIRLLLQLSQEENLLRNIVIGFPVVVTIQQFLLKHQQPLRNAVFLGRGVIPQHKHP